MFQSSQFQSIQFQSHAYKPLAVVFCVVSYLSAASIAAAQTYEVTKTFHVGGSGGWDYLTLDPATNRLYVPRTTHTMVLDAASGQTLADIAGQTHNHGVALVPNVGRGFITDDASVVVFDLKTNEALGRIAVAEDADGILYDPGCNKVLVGCGDAGVMVPIAPDVDPKSGKADPAIALGGKPESAAAADGKIYVSIVNKDEVAVIDGKTMKVEHNWPTAPAGQPVGMAVDPARHMLFVGCRKPPKMLVMSSVDGQILADLPIGAGADFTAVEGDAFASCRDGTMTVVRENSSGKFEVAQTVATKVGARTLALDRKTRTIYLPTADLKPAAAGKRPKPVADTFVILVVTAKK